MPSFLHSGSPPSSLELGSRVRLLAFRECVAVHMKLSLQYTLDAVTILYKGRLCRCPVPLPSPAGSGAGVVGEAAGVGRHCTHQADTVYEGHLFPCTPSVSVSCATPFRCRQWSWGRGRSCWRSARPSSSCAPSGPTSSPRPGPPQATSPRYTAMITVHCNDFCALQ